MGSKGNYGRAWTDADDAELTRLMYEGKSQGEIAAIVGRPPSGITNRAVRLGLNMRDHEAILRNYVRERWERVPLKEIARAAKTSVDRITRIGAEFGLSPKDAPASMPKPEPRRYPWDIPTIIWAQMHRETDPEARIIAGEMDRIVAVTPEERRPGRPRKDTANAA